MRGEKGGAGELVAGIKSCQVKLYEELDYPFSFFIKWEPHTFLVRKQGIKELNICKGKCVKAQKKSRMLNFHSNAELSFFLLKVGVTCKTERLY